MSRKTDPQKVLIARNLRRGNPITISLTDDRKAGGPIAGYYYRLEYRNQQPHRLWYRLVPDGPLLKLPWPRLTSVQRRQAVSPAMAGSFSTGHTDGAQPQQAYSPSPARRGKRMTDEELKQAVDCYREDLSVSEAQVITDLSEQVVRRVYRVCRGEDAVASAARLPKRIKALGFSIPVSRVEVAVPASALSPDTASALAALDDVDESAMLDVNDAANALTAMRKAYAYFAEGLPHHPMCEDGTGNITGPTRRTLSCNADCIVRISDAVRFHTGPPSSTGDAEVRGRVYGLRRRVVEVWE